MQRQPGANGGKRQRDGGHRAVTVLVVGLIVGWAAPSAAADFLVTIGGGYKPSANQASLEANVQLYQQVLRQTHPGAWVHEIYFADGLDPQADLQVAVARPKSRGELEEVLASLHRAETAPVEYRDHQLEGVSGPNEPDLIQNCLKRLAAEAKPGDRIILYVATHGGEADGDDPYNTTIDGWNDKSVTARELGGWLDEISPDVTVLVVMAQCYCGGYAHTLLRGPADVAESSPQVDPEAPPRLPRQLRVGFFAQQHDLAAAGCRPDIESDEEFSSYFWGAMLGHSRTGRELPTSDLNHDGKVSFLEAYAQVLAHCHTIDIPLRMSDVLLETYSRTEATASDAAAAADASRRDDDSTTSDAAALMTLTGPIADALRVARPELRYAAEQLLEQTKIDASDRIEAIFAGLAAERRAARRTRRGGPPRRGASGRRELLMDIKEQWPDLADPQAWRDSALLQPEQLAETTAQIKALDSYQVYVDRRQQRQQARDAAQASELRQVQFRRLISVVSTIVREQNLPQLAPADVVTYYRRMMDVETHGF